MNFVWKITITRLDLSLSNSGESLEGRGLRVQMLMVREEREEGESEKESCLATTQRCMWIDEIYSDLGGARES